MRRPAVVVAIMLIVGASATAIALQSREGNTQFVAEQQGLLPVNAASVQRLLITTSDPRPRRGGRARTARCQAAPSNVSADRWSCLVAYPRPPPMRYRVSVRADRSILGVGRSVGAMSEASSTVSGCCVESP
jgi:hypothetical protein